MSLALGKISSQKFILGASYAWIGCFKVQIEFPQCPSHKRDSHSKTRNFYVVPHSPVSMSELLSQRLQLKDVYFGAPQKKSMHILSDCRIYCPQHVKYGRLWFRESSKPSLATPVHVNSKFYTYVESATIKS